MKKLTRLIAIIFAVTMCATVTACGTTEESNATVVNIMNNGGGCGRIWLDNAIARFQEKIGDKSYAEGKQGVKFEIEHNINTSTGTMGTSGYDIYFTTSDGYPRNLAQRGFLYDLTDFMNEKFYDDGKTSVLDKIDPDYLDVLKGTDGKFYAIPHEEWFPGLTYDADLFKANNLYIAAPDETNVREYSCAYGSVNFVKDSTAKKSLGNDGKPNTYDDGLPTTLVEFLVLCSKLKNDLSVTPFTVSGLNAQYTNYLTESLWASLAGYDGFRRAYTFDGEMEIVTGYTDEPLFKGINYKDDGDKLKAIYKPVTEKITLTEETGYHATSDVNKYYASAFMQVIYDEGWYSQDSSNQSAHTAAQSNFIFSGKNGKEKVAFMIEGDYWFNESVTVNNFRDYKTVYPNEPDRDLRWMPLPTSLDTPVTTEEEGRPNVLLDTGASFTFVNKRTASKTDGCLEAVKDFLEFIYSDEEMSHFTECTGLGKAAMKYQITEEDEAKMQEFKKSIWQLRRDNKVIYGSASNETFLSSPISFVPYQSSESNFYYLINGKLYICDLYAHRAGYGARNCFPYTQKTLEQWKSIYRGSKTL